MDRGPILVSAGARRARACPWLRLSVPTARPLRTTARLAALLVAAGTLCLSGRPAAAQSLRRLALDTLASSVRFDGHATLGAFSATTRTLSGWAELSGGSIATGRGAVEVRAATLRTGIGLRDRHLRGELDTDHYPTIALTVDHVLAAGGGAPAVGGPVVLEGTLTVKGTPHPVRLAATATLRGDILLVAGSSPLTFTQLGMKPPTRMLGMTRVQDAFVLAYDVRFTPTRP